MSDARIPPSPWRMKRGFRAGLRPQVPSLLRGCLYLAIFAGGSGVWLLLKQWLRMGLQGGLTHNEFFHGGLALKIVAGWMVAFAAAVLALSVVVQLALGNLGPRRHDLEFAGMNTAMPGWVQLALGALTAVLMGTALRPLVGAAVLSLEASPRGLFQVWQAWSMRTCLSLGLILLMVGLLEFGIHRWLIWRALHLTPQQSRAASKR